jgi:hypothetical protein
MKRKEKDWLTYTGRFPLCSAHSRVGHLHFHPPRQPTRALASASVAYTWARLICDLHARPTSTAWGRDNMSFFHPVTNYAGGACGISPQITVVIDRHLLRVVKIWPNPWVFIPIPMAAPSIWTSSSTFPLPPLHAQPPAPTELLTGARCAPPVPLLGFSLYSGARVTSVSQGASLGLAVSLAMATPLGPPSDGGLKH